MRDSVLHLTCRSVAVATLILIVAGGLVTSTGSGLSVPDWPLSYGQFFPPMVGGIRFEHTHRVIAGIVAIMTVGMVFLLFCYDKRGWVRNLGLIAVSTVLLQVVLGGLTVIYLLPTWISVAHACLAQTFFSLVVILAWVTSNSWKDSDNASPPAYELLSLRRLALITVAFIYLQLLVGAVVRHAKGDGMMVHVGLAFVVVLHVVLLIRKASLQGVGRKLLPHALWMGVLVLVQVFLGLGALIFKWVLPLSEFPRTGQVLLTAAHQSNGAVLLATGAVMALRSFRSDAQNG